MNGLLRSSQLFIKRNASTILTTLGGVGVVATAVMAVKATPKAMLIIDQIEMEKGEKLTKTEIVVAAAPVYIPTILVGAGTIACVFGANILNQRQQAALMSAYALLDSSCKDYKDKVKELYGSEGSDRVRDELANDRYEEQGFHVTPGEQLFYDDFSGQFFESTIEEVQKAELQVNRDIQLQSYATLSEFYDMLGIDYDDGGLLGWSEGGNFARYWQSWVDFAHTKRVMEDGVECIVLTIFQEPYMEFEDDC